MSKPIGSSVPSYLNTQKLSSNFLNSFSYNKLEKVAVLTFPYAVIFERVKKTIENGNPPPSTTQRFINSFSAGFITGGLISPLYHAEVKPIKSPILIKLPPLTSNMIKGAALRGGLLGFAIEAVKTLL